MGDGLVGTFNQPAAVLLHQNKVGERGAASGRGRFDFGNRFHQGKAIVDQSQVVHVDLEFASLASDERRRELLLDIFAAVGPGPGGTDELAVFGPAGCQALGVAFVETGFQLGQQGKDGLPLRGSAGRLLFHRRKRRGDRHDEQDGKKSSNQTLHVKGSMNEKVHKSG